MNAMNENHDRFMQCCFFKMTAKSHESELMCFSFDFMLLIMSMHIFHA